MLSLNNWDTKANLNIHVLGLKSSHWNNISLVCSALNSKSKQLNETKQQIAYYEMRSLKKCDFLSDAFTLRINSEVLDTAWLSFWYTIQHKTFIMSRKLPQLLSNCFMRLKGSLGLFRKIDEVSTLNFGPYCRLAKSFGCSSYPEINFDNVSQY